MKKTIRFEVEKEVIDKFSVALNLEKDTRNSVIEKLMIDYIQKVFTKASEIGTPSTSAANVDGSNSKAYDKLPLWANRKNQYNHKIIRAYLILSEKKDCVTYSDLEERCSNQEIFPDTYVPRLYGNYQSMKTDKGNSHGKVFEEDGDCIRLWDPVKERIMNLKSKFIR